MSLHSGGFDFTSMDSAVKFYVSIGYNGEALELAHTVASIALFLSSLFKDDQK